MTVLILCADGASTLWIVLQGQHQLWYLMCLNRNPNMAAGGLHTENSGQGKNSGSGLSLFKAKPSCLSSCWGFLKCPQQKVPSTNLPLYHFMTKSLITEVPARRRNCPQEETQGHREKVIKKQAGNFSIREGSE